MGWGASPPIHVLRASTHGRGAPDPQLMADMIACGGRSSRWVFYGPGYSFKGSGFGDRSAIEMAERNMAWRGLDAVGGHWRKLDQQVRTYSGMADAFVWTPADTGLNAA